MGLMHTNIPELTGVELDYIGFSYGGPLNQAALAGEVDLMLTADQPAAALMFRSDGYKVVARMMNNRTCTYVPPESSVRSLKDLSAKSLAGPVGAAAERVVLAALKDNGLELDSINFGNIDMGQQAALIAAGSSDGKWGRFDAMYGFDPMPAVFEADGAARMIHCGKVVSVVLASVDLIKNRSEDLTNFLTAFRLSWNLFASDPDRMNDRFIEHSQLGFSRKALEIAATVERNMDARAFEDVELLFSEDDFSTFDGAVEFLMSRGIVKEPLDVRDSKYIDLTAAKAVMAQGFGSDLVDKIKLKP